ncbi:MAG: hypothetical protein BAJALOKI1v1_440006 [Promethearchaeota archaeon]|nr:MAG: hypothetical protein BAJALOKI1v1_440006 [Candidatus Lokiarchaeota archaeon]
MTHFIFNPKEYILILNSQSNPKDKCKNKGDKINDKNKKK